VQSTGQAYKKYTPFYKDAIQRRVMPSVGTPYATVFKKMKGRYSNSIGLNDALSRFTTINDNILVRGGRTLGMQRLRQAVKQQKHYLDTRDYFPKKTSHLSAYIKFGCVSIREVYFSFSSEYNKNHGLISELYWREFFAHVLNCYPQVVGNSYQEKYRNLDWVNNRTHIKKWKEGATGFPLVDAAMREMNATGYMHNRGRMTAASVLIKTLRVDWRIGEKYFATQLTDYDIASNNGNWQGISGTGVDMKPYFRDMNPFIQSEKFDKDCEYIKEWVPELKDVPARDIHNWYDAHKNYGSDVTTYPAPIVDYKTAKEEMIQMYKKAK
jgi:deoxyribodipyrimidine photo-lyase